MSERIEAEIEAAAKAIADIPVSGGAYMALYQETFGMTVSRTLLDRIAKVALEAAARVRANPNDLENDARCTAQTAACKTPIEIIEEKQTARN